MPNDVSHAYFARYVNGQDYQEPLIVQAFVPGTGWVQCARPYEYLSDARVQGHADAGATALALSAYGHNADFTIRPGGILEPASLQ